MVNEGLYDWSNYTILIADDDEGNYTLLRFMLEDTKVNLLWAKDGVEAVEYCKSESVIDLVLMDVKMPNVDGIEATKTIKLLNPDLPIVMQSAHILEEVKLTCFEVGCNEFLTKPFDEDIFYKVVDFNLNKNKQ